MPSWSTCSTGLLAERTPEVARSLLDPEWDRLVTSEPELGSLFAAETDLAAWLGEAGVMLDRYFTLEDPRRLEPAHRELSVEAELASGLRLRGYIDRLDVAPGGQTRIVDYKTGSAPPAEFEARALFQMKFYALVLWRAQGRVPRLLQLIYLGNGEIVRYEPDEADLRATERKIEALWQAIERARQSRDWRPRPGRLCDWCAHKALCPAFGGTPPDLPARRTCRPRPPVSWRPARRWSGTTSSEPGLLSRPVVDRPCLAAVGPGSRVAQWMLCRRRMSATSPRSSSAAGALLLAGLSAFPAGAPAAAPGRPVCPGGGLTGAAAPQRAGDHEQHDGQAGQGHAGPHLRREDEGGREAADRGADLPQHLDRVGQVGGQGQQ